MSSDHIKQVKQAIQGTGSGTPAQIAEETGLTPREVSQALAHMEVTGEAAHAHQGKFGATVWDATN